MDQTAVFDFVLQKDADLVSFALGLPNADLFPLAELRAAADDILGGADAYQYANPPAVLREHIVGLMALRGVSCTAEQIVLTNGAQHGIDMAVRLLDGDGPVVLEEITYTGALAVTQSCAAPVHTLRPPPGTASGTGSGTAAAVAELVRAGVRPRGIYVMPEGHNPLGASMPQDERRELTALARAHRFTVIEDDAYGFLQYGDEPRPALRAGEEHRVLYVGTFSKIVAPGLRVGWLVVPEHLMGRAMTVKEASALEVATVGQCLLARLLQRWDLAGHLAALRAEYALRRDVMRRCLAEILPAGTSVSSPDSGMFFWLELEEGVDTGQLLKTAAAEYGVSYLPGEMYFADPERARRNCLRLSFSCVSPREIETGTERLGRLLHEHAGAGQVR